MRKSITRKCLSILLALLMVFGCISATLVPAAATKDQIIAQGNTTIQTALNELGTAIQAAYDNGALDKMTFAGYTDGRVTSNNTTLTGRIIENTPDGYLLAVAEKFDALLKSGPSSGAQNTQFIFGRAATTSASATNSNNLAEPYGYTWWTNLYRGLTSWFEFPAGSPQQHLLAALTNMKGNNDATLTLKANDVYFTADQYNAVESEAGSYTTNVRIRAERTDLAILRGLHSYTEVQAFRTGPALPASVETGVNGAVGRRSVTSGCSTDYYYHNYFAAKSTSNPVAIARTNITTFDNTDRLIAFYNHFLVTHKVGTADETNPFILNEADARALETANNTAWNNAIRSGGLTEADVAQILTQTTVDQIKLFMYNCKSGRELLTNAYSIEYFMGGTASVPTGFNADIAAGKHLPLKLYDLQTWWAEQQTHYGLIMGLSEAGKEQATLRLGMDLPAIDIARNIMRKYFQQMELERIKAGIDEFAAPFEAYKDAYTGPLPTSPTDEPAWSDYNDYLDAYFYGFADSELLGMDATMAGLLTALGGYTDTDLVFTDGTAYANEFKYYLSKELLRRNLTASQRGYHTYFNKILSDDLTKLSDDELMALYSQASGKKVEFYNAMEADISKIGTPGWTQQGFDWLYTSFLPTIDDAMDKIGNTMLARMTAELDVFGSLWDGAINEVTYENVWKLRKYYDIDLVDVQLYNLLATTPYMTEELQAKFERVWNDDGILAQYNRYMLNYGIDMYVQKHPDYPFTRYPYATDLARAGDPEKYDVDNELMNETVAKLDALLKSPGFIDLTGFDLGGYLSGALDGLYSDAMLNTIIQQLYPAVLGGLEGQFKDLPAQASNGGNPGWSSACIRGCVKALSCGCVELPDNLTYSVTRYNLVSLHDILGHGTATINQLKLYPDLLGNFLATKYPEFATAANVLKLANTAPSGNWKTYETNAWEHDALRNADGSLKLDWGIDNQPASGPLSTMNKEERFRHAFSSVLDGVWPLLAALLCGQDIRLDHPNVAQVTVRASMLINIDVKIDALALGLGVDTPAYGYADLLASFYEGVLGLDNDGILTVAQLQALGAARPLVDGIFDPLVYYIKDVLGETPLAGILELLPNLSYAMIFDRILYALKKLKVDLNLIPSGAVDGMDRVRNCAGTFGFGDSIPPKHPDYGDTIKGLAGGEDPKMPVAFNLIEQMGGACNLTCLSYPDTLFACLTSPTGCIGGCLMGCLGGGALPCLNIGEMVRYGQMTSGPSKRLPSTWTDYVPREVPISVPYEVEEEVEVDLLDEFGFPIPVLEDDGMGNMIPVLEDDGMGNMVTVYEKTTELQLVTKYRDETTTVYDIVTSTKNENNYHIDADEGDVLLFLLRSLLGGDALGGLLGGLLGGGDMGDIIGGILANAGANGDDAIAAIVELFNPKPSGFYAEKNINWLYKDGSNPKVGYTNLWTKKDAQFVVDNFMEYVNDIIRLLGIYDSNGKLYTIEGLLDGLVGGLDKSIYSGSLLNSLAVMLKDLISGLDLGDEINSLIQDQLGISLSAWDFVTEGYFDYIEDGDRAAFVDGLLKLLRPVYPLLGFLLNAQDISLFGTPVLALDGDGNPIPVLDGAGNPVLDGNGDPVYEYTMADAAITASGYEGYANGIIPLLEALGAKDVLTPAQYKTAITQDPDAILTAIINPLLDVVDGILADPLNEVLHKLPNIIYYVNSGGLQVSVDNTLQAVYVLLDTIRPLFPVDLDLFGMLTGELSKLLGGAELDLSLNGLSSLVIGLINDALGTAFVLPKGSLDFLMVGTLTPFTSKNSKAAYKLEVTDDADMITALLRFAVEFLFCQNNRAVVVDLLGGLVGTDLDAVKQIDAIFSFLRDLHLCLFGTDLVLHTLLNTFYTVGSFTEGRLNLLDRVNKNWVAILTAMEASGNEAVSSFATGLKKFLDNNFNDILDSQGKQARGLIPFFTAIWAWLQKIWGWITWPFTALFGLFS